MKRVIKNHIAIFVAFLIVLSSVLGILISTAFFSAGEPDITYTDNVGTKSLELTYDDCNVNSNPTCGNVQVVLSPGQSTIKNFTVKNTTDTSATFDIYFKELLNTFINDELVYTIEETNSSWTPTGTKVINNQPVPYKTSLTKDLKITTSQISIAANTTKYYKLTVTLLNTDYDQTPNKNAKFKIKLGITGNWSYVGYPVYNATTLDKAKLGAFVNANTPESLVITEVGGHADGTDVGTDTGHIYAWMDGTTAYVSAKEPGYRIKLPADATSFFCGNSTYSGYNSYRTVTNLNVSLLDTSSVTTMNYMFFYAGYNVTSSFSLEGLSSWDTSSVTDMSYMFNNAGRSATTSWSIGDLSGWDTSSVTTMNYMFYYAGYKAAEFNLDLSGWDTSSVTSMSYMFYYAGYNVTSSWSIGDLSGWDTSSVTTMNYMFFYAGYSATTSWSIGDLSGWDTSSVTDMSYMFQSAGYKAPEFKLDLSGWDTSSVTNMRNMFSNAGYSATSSWSIGDLSGWDTSSVTNMSYMFPDAGYKAAEFKLNLSGWDTSSVTNMSSMFNNAGYKAAEFKLNLSGWDTSSVTNMSYMFQNAGYTASASNWIVTIPANTGTTSNDTTHFYGSGTTYASPASGKTFTLFGHHYELLSSTASTCTTQGHAIYRCNGGNGCTLNHTDNVDIEVELPLGAHSFDSTHICTVCGASQLDTLRYKNEIVTTSKTVTSTVSGSNYDYYSSKRPYYSKIITIVAPKTGSYNFQASSSSQNYMRLYNLSMESLAYPSTSSTNTTLTADLTAGEIYYLAVGMYSSSSTSYTITTTITMP